jgi:PhzF family phenazine biosynthesis protein
MPQSIVVVDAFASRPFAGNPAAVCLLDRPREDGWMQAVAREMNHSETAFLHPEGVPDSYRLRWFTPRTEVDLCGHATLAAAHVLWEQSSSPSGESVHFNTRSGRLIATQNGDWIELDFPTLKTDPRALPPGLIDALLGEHEGDSIRFVGQTRFDLLVEVSDESALKSLAPNFAALASLPYRGVIVTCRPNREGALHAYDFLSRFFAPAAGVNEDPVTGSAHCALGLYWSRKLGRDDLCAYQASERGGVMRLKVDSERTVLAGQAITVLRGELLNVD